MKLFLDSANLDEIMYWMGQGVLDGVTTNPSILRRDQSGQDILLRIADVIAPRPISIEVETDELKSIMDEAMAITTVRPARSNVVVKVPVITRSGESCLGTVYELCQAGLRINVTACMSFGQAILATKSGAEYVSLFFGRIDDEGHDGAGVIRSVRQWIDDWGYRSEIIAGSLRSPMDVQRAAMTGAHAITIPPAVLRKMVDHKFTRHTVAEFLGKT